MRAPWTTPTREGLHMTAWDNETITYVGVLVGTAIGAAVAYFRKAPPPPPSIEPALKSIGLELGNRQQTDQIIEQLKRIADALNDKNTAGITDRLEELAEQIDRMTEARRR